MQQVTKPRPRVPNFNNAALRQALPPLNCRPVLIYDGLNLASGLCCIVDPVHVALQTSMAVVVFFLIFLICLGKRY